MWPWWLTSGEWRNLPTEDFTDETLAIDDTQGVDVNLI